LGNMRKLRQSFLCAIRGISLCIRNERNFRIHICVALYASAFALIAGFGVGEFSLLFLCFASVMATELLNTSIERICDLYSEKYSIRIKAIKDIAAGAVLITAVFAFLSGSVLFLRKEAFGAVLGFIASPKVILLLLCVPVTVFFIIGQRRK